MNKIRVIDLLNKIANGEELPRKLKGNNHTYTLVENRNYEDEDGDILFSDDYFWCNEDFLNKELEIIEEDKEIEEIKCLEIKKISEMYCLSSKNISEEEKWEKTRKLIYEYRIDLENLKYCINELIEAVNELKKGK